MMAKKAPSNPVKINPADILERYRGLVPADIYACILSELDRPLPQGLRINQLQDIGTAEVDCWAKKYGWEMKAVPFCQAGWQVLSAITSPSQTVEHGMGAFYIQEASSMLPPELFEYAPSGGELILDLAASPGGKTTHLVDKTGDRSLVIANDASRSRIQALRLALERWSAINVAVTCQPGELFGAWYPGVFDKVLLDAPCSMEGLRTAESHPMRPVTSHERESLANRQVRLLASALKAVRTGGQVVYSTCTLAPEEDEQVLAAIKKRYGSAIEILAPNLGVQAAPLQIPQVEGFADISHALRLWPHLYNTAGFFAALLRKTGSIDNRGEDNHPPQQRWLHQGWVRLNSRAFRELVQAMRDQYGFNLQQVIEQQGISFWERNGRIQAVPVMFLERFGDFPVVSCGLEVGNMIAGKLQPSHEWAARFTDRFSSGKLIIPEDQISNWMRGGDVKIPLTTNLQQGCVVCMINSEGRFIGRGKLLAGRVKNLLPRRLVA